MGWVTTTDVGEFLAVAGPFLDADPVANTALLTEAHFWSQLSERVPAARFGWYAEATEVLAAFVDIPNHPPICSPLSTEAIADLPRHLPHAGRVAVQARDAASVAAAWQATRGRVLRPSAPTALLRLQDFRPQPLPTGTARVADAGDLPLLRNWFGLFQQQFPDDPSHVEFVVDQPLRDGGVVVWELQGRPVAMASRTPMVAGMVRMGLAFQPIEGSTYADACFAVASEEAARTAEHVLVFSASPDSTATYSSLGFAFVLERVVLEAQ
jgi:hypothetical protein